MNALTGKYWLNQLSEWQRIDHFKQFRFNGNDENCCNFKETETKFAWKFMPVQNLPNTGSNGAQQILLVQETMRYLKKKTTTT